jgi:hypothetical protein
MHGAWQHGHVHGIRSGWQQATATTTGKAGCAARQADGVAGVALQNLAK